MIARGALRADRTLILRTLPADSLPWTNGEMCIVERSFDLLFDRLAQPLGSAAGELGFATAVAGCRCRACRDPALPRLSSPANQINQPFKSVLAIAFLRPETPRHDDENAICGHSPSGEQAQSGSRRVVEARRVEGIEAELDGGGDLVDVLSAGAAGANEDLFDLVLVDRDAVGDRDHLPWSVLTLEAGMGRDRGDFVRAAIANDSYAVHVQPKLVVEIEIAFSDIQASPHYPGVLPLRFARIKRYRPDKKAEEADTIETIRALYERRLNKES